MTIGLKTSGIHHITLRCMDFNRTKTFYRDVLGLQLVMETETLIIFASGNVFIAFKQAEPKSQASAVFSPFEVGLDHLALACESEEELKRFAKGLKDAEIENTGVKMDETLQKLYVAFKDPDKIQWEFYMTK